MKVLMVNTMYRKGGAAGVAQILHRELNRLDGYESLFAYGRGPKAEGWGTLRFSVQPEVYCHALLTRVSGIQGYGTWLSTRRLLRLIRQWKPDLIHCHNIHGYYLDLSIAKTVGDLGIPIVWTLHDAWPLTGRCAYFFDCERWKTRCGRCPYLREYPKTWFDSSAWMWSRKRKLLADVWRPVIATPSQWLADLVLEASGGRCPVQVIPNGVDSEVFRPLGQAQARKELGLPQGKKIVLFAAADLKEERKGARYFLKSLQHVNVDNWMALAVGKVIHIKGWLRPGIEFRQLGYIKRAQEMARVYSSADLFCITSLDDNFPATVLEAMACGTPVVGFATGGIPEQVAGGCGQLVPPRDVKALGEVITALLKDEPVRRETAERCRKRAVQEYSLQRFVERYCALYHELVKGSLGTRR